MEVGFPEEPLTDNECPWQGDESPPPSPSRNTPAAAPRPQLSRREKKKARDNERRRTKRAAAGGPGCNGAKKVAKKRRLEATKDLLRVDLDLAGHTRVTKPAWVGRRVNDLPRREFTKDELVKAGFTYLPWDGR